MTDKSRRKQSKRERPLLRLRSLVLLYVLFLIPYFSDSQSLLYILIAHTIVLGVLLVGGFFMRVVGRLKENFLTTLIIAVIGGVSALIAWILFTIAAFLGLLSWIIFLFFVLFIPFLITCGIAIVLLGIYLLFVLELDKRISEFMNPVQDYEMMTEDQKNDDSSRLSSEPEEPDTPLELLAESESAEQRMK